MRARVEAGNKTIAHFRYLAILDRRILGVVFRRFSSVTELRL
jgi:hypothetical protein